MNSKLAKGILIVVVVGALGLVVWRYATNPIMMVNPVPQNPHSPTQADAGTKNSAGAGAPAPVQASPSGAPACSLAVSAEGGSHQFSGTDEGNEVAVSSRGGWVKVVWASAGATEALLATKDTQEELSTSGQATYTIQQDGSYVYTFTGPKGSVTCAFAVRIATSSFDTASLTAHSSEPTITGRIGDASSVRLTVAGLDAGSAELFDSGIVPVTNGVWSVSVSKTIPDGTYWANLYDGFTNMYLQSAHLVVSAQGTGSFSITPTVEPTDRLVRPGENVPAVLIKVTNTGTGLAALNGFYLERLGTGPGVSIVGYGTGNDVGGCAGGGGNLEGYSPFSQSDSIGAYCSETLSPGETRTFTITIAVSKYAGYYAGQSFQILVTGIDTGSPVDNKYLPVYGGRFTIAGQ
jgi:hypothetical protein